MNVLDKTKGKLVALNFVLWATIVLRELQAEAADEFSVPAAFTMNIAGIVEVVKIVERPQRF